MLNNQHKQQSPTKSTSTSSSSDNNNQGYFIFDDLQTALPIERNNNNHCYNFNNDDSQTKMSAIQKLQQYRKIGFGEFHKKYKKKTLQSTKYQKSTQKYIILYIK
jgi:ligand-binding SRPBCC domain-containing protein